MPTSQPVRSSRRFAATRPRRAWHRQPVLLLDKNGIIRDASPAACHMLRCEAEEVVQDDFFEMVDDPNLRRVMWDMAEMACRGRTVANWTLRLKTGNGPKRPVRIQAQNRLHRAEHAGVELHLHPAQA